MLDRDRAQQLHGSESDGFEQTDIAPSREYTIGDRSGHDDAGGDQDEHTESREECAEERVDGQGIAAGILPILDAGDRVAMTAERLRTEGRGGRRIVQS